MKIALFLTNDVIDEHDREMLPIMILYADKNVVVGVEKDILVNKDVNYLALWLLTKKIEYLYVMDIDPLIRKMFEKIGVKVYTFPEVGKNHFIKRFFDDIFVS